MLECRVATDADKDQVYDLIKQYGEEFNVEIDEISTKAYIDYCFGYTRILVVEDQGRVVGALSYIETIHKFTGRMIAVKLEWFMEKAYRGVENDLLQRMEQMSKLLGCTQIWVTATHDKVKQSLEGQGYVVWDTKLVKEI